MGATLPTTILDCWLSTHARQPFADRSPYRHGSRDTEEPFPYGAETFTAVAETMPFNGPTVPPIDPTDRHPNSPGSPAQNIESRFGG